METIAINREQLIEKIGEIVPFGYQPKNSKEHVFEMYMWGKIPVLVCSQYSKEEFELLYR